MGCFVNFGADWHGPGQILFGNRGAVVVGEIDGATRERTRAMHELLQLFEPDAVLTDNIWGYLWGKLAYGAMLFAHLAERRFDVGEFRRPAALRGVRHARARGHRGRQGARHHAGRLPRVRSGGLRARRRAKRARAPRSRALAEYTSHGAKTHSGVWRDLAVRKRKTEVDQQIAHHRARSAREAGIATPGDRPAGRADPRRRGRPPRALFRRHSRS